jgi:hypothetical protein
MGQYLAMGIATSVAISKEKAEKEKLTLEEVIQKMQNTLYFAPEIYDFTEEKTYWVWTLKKQIWEKELLSFLKVLYPLFYTGRNSGDYVEVIEKLGKEPPATWLLLAGDKPFEAFQLDEYGEYGQLYFDDKPFKPNLKVSYECIALATEGKIAMETYGQFFSFFMLCFQKAFPKFQLSKAIRVYITG